MRNSRLLPYETIVQATSGEPEAVNLVLQHYRGYIRYAARISGQADRCLLYTSDAADDS